MLDRGSFDADRLDPQAAAVLALFEYMIGNTDWSITAFHNMKVMRVGLEYYPIPYDFDFSGLVDAPYAGPDPSLAHLIDSVRERLFRGICSDRIDYLALFDLLNQRREAILDLIRTQPGLSEDNRASAAGYVEGFFREIQDPEQAQRKFTRICRG